MDFSLIKMKNIYESSENVEEKYAKENIWNWESGFLVITQLDAQILFNVFIYL